MAFGMTTAEMLHWSLIFLLIVIALISIVFSTLAWSDSRSTQPHRDLTRQDVKARCDLCVDGDATFGGAVQLDDGLSVCGPSRLRQVCVESLCFGQVQTINVAGTFQLTAKQSSYRIDAAGTNQITLLLPSVAQAPGHVFYITISVAGAGNTVMLDIADGDVLCNGTCIGTNPAFSFPTVAGNADAIMVTNDSVSAWFVSGHVNGPI